MRREEYTETQEHAAEIRRGVPKDAFFHLHRLCDEAVPAVFGIEQIDEERRCRGKQKQTADDTAGAVVDPAHGIVVHQYRQVAVFPPTISGTP